MNVTIYLLFAILFVKLQTSFNDVSLLEPTYYSLVRKSFLAKLLFTVHILTYPSLYKL